MKPLEGATTVPQACTWTVRKIRDKNKGWSRQSISIAECWFVDGSGHGRLILMKQLNLGHTLFWYLLEVNEVLVLHWEANTDPKFRVYTKKNPNQRLIVEFLSVSSFLASGGKNYVNFEAEGEKKELTVLSGYLPLEYLARSRSQPKPTFFVFPKRKFKLKFRRRPWESAVSTISRGGGGVKGSELQRGGIREKSEWPNLFFSFSPPKLSMKLVTKLISNEVAPLRIIS